MATTCRKMVVGCFIVAAISAFNGGCATDPVYRYVTHTGKTDTGRMCEMQAHSARATIALRGTECKWEIDDPSSVCQKCAREYREGLRHMRWEHRHDLRQQLRRSPRKEDGKSNEELKVGSFPENAFCG